jgi:hypothetical protein
LRVFGLGTLLGVLAVTVSFGATEPIVWKAGQWLGASVGAGFAWYYFSPPSFLSTRQMVAVGVPISLLWITIYVTSPPLAVTAVGTALAGGITIAAPALLASG